MRRFNRLSLGEFHSRDEAEIVLQIARFYYDKDQGCVHLDDGQFKFFIPPMNEQERGLADEEKRKFVTHKVKQAYADLGIQKRTLEKLSVGNKTDFFLQQSSLNYEMHYLGFGQILAGPSSPQADGATQGILDSIDAHLSPHIDFQQGWDLVGATGSNFFAEPRDPVLQQLVHRQKQELEVYALRIVVLEHQLCESQIQIQSCNTRMIVFNRRVSV